VPGLGSGLAQFPAVLDHFGQAVRFREKNVDNLAAVRHYPFETVVWIELSLAFVLALAGAATLVGASTGRDGTPARTSG
jgi:hypothetical protein